MLIFDKYRESYQVEGYKQFDVAKPLEARFLDNAKPINLANYNLRFECLKPDGHIVVQDTNLTVKNTNEITMVIDKQVTTVEGVLKCQFVLLNKTGGAQDTTFTFFIDVQKSAINIATYSDSVITMTETINTRTNEATKVNGTLTTTINNAKSTDTTLKQTDTNAKATNTTLTATNRTATATNQTLTTTNQTATTTKNELTTLNTNATTTKNQLTTINQTATQTKTDLTTLNTNATKTKTDLTSINNTATTTKTDLTAINTTATTTKNQLTQINTTAGNTKTQLDQSNTTALETKRQLDQSNANAQNNMAQVSIEDFTGTSLPTNEVKVRIKKSDGTYRVPVTRADAVFVSQNVTLTTVLNNKVDKVNGKQLSTNDYTANEKTTVTWATDLKNSGGTIGGETIVSGNIVSSGGNIACNDGYIVAKGDVSSTAGAIIGSTGVTANAGNIEAKTGDVVSSNSLFGNRLQGRAVNTNQTNNMIGIGAGTCRIDTTGNIFRMFSTARGSDNGILINADGSLEIKSGNVTKHKLNANGTKSPGGTMEVDGTFYGMSPTDSFQTLIEYIIPNVKVENELRLELDPIYVKMVSYYVAFASSRHIDIVEKGSNYIILRGNGMTDILIKGQRKDAEDYYRIMGGINHGVNSEETV